jgi:3-deoxy-D-manno-octulosonate 8-phosphate phosphatase (KDO 8-P phosphatase)
MSLLTTRDLSVRAAAVRLVALDVDGVLTDGRLYFGPQGDTLKAFNVRDGHGLRLLAQAGIELAIITGRQSEIVTRRAADLGIRYVMQGCHDKLTAFQTLLAQTGLRADQCAYMGDDWPDLPVLAKVGLATTVADAPAEVLERAHWISPSGGGSGAVRELAELILRAQQRFDAMLADLLRHE